MNEIRDESLVRLAQLILGIPPCKRAAALQAALAFAPADSISRRFAIGPLRAAIAGFWEQAIDSPIPFLSLRETLKPPIARDTELSFTRVASIETRPELEQGLRDLLSHLNHKVAEAASPPVGTQMPPEFLGNARPPLFQNKHSQMRDIP